MKVTMTPIRFCTFSLIAVLAITPTRAMVGGAPAAADGAGRSVVMILGSGGTACTATAIARDLLLDRCALRAAGFRIQARGQRAG